MDVSERRYPAPPGFDPVRACATVVVTQRHTQTCPAPACALRAGRRHSHLPAVRAQRRSVKLYMPLRLSIPQSLRAISTELSIICLPASPLPSAPAPPTLSLPPLSL